MSFLLGNTSRLRRVTVAGVLAAALTLSAAPAAFAGEPEGTVGNIQVQRVSGVNRVETAVKISQEYFVDGADVVYLATANSFADALVAGPAAAFQNGPVLLSKPTVLDPAVSEEIQRLQPSRVVIAGGEGAISAAIEAELQALVGGTAEVVRQGGSNRYETSRLIVEDAFDGYEVQEAFLATGVDYPDALSAAPLAGAYGAPVILVPGKSAAADAETLNFLDSLAVEAAVLVGGNGVITDGFEESLLEAVPETYRYAGANRYETNAAVNYDLYGFSGEAMIATGLDFPDALAGAAPAGLFGTPIYLAKPSCVPATALEQIHDVEYTTETVTLLGGTGVLGDGVAQLKSC